MRLFAAIFPSKDELDRILAIRDMVRTTLIGNLSWTLPEKIHLTLRFFGDNAEETDAALAVDKAVAGIGRFAIQFDAVAGFPARQRARVVVLESRNPTDEVLRLGSILNLGESKPFRPHITLARARNRPVKVDVKDFEPVHMQVSEVCLVHSVLSGANAGYHVLKRWRLNG